MTPVLYPYVLFREDPNTHKEVYLAHISKSGRAYSTRDPRDAIRFETAAAGYALGSAHNLEWWHVGRRIYAMIPSG